MVRTEVPARTDRLPWSSWHGLMLVGLGTVWILDGLEATIVSALSDRLTEPGSGLVLSQVGLASSCYVTGAVCGSLVFGYLTEYAAINSAIGELVPARWRATVSLAVNGSYWFGAAGGAALSLVLLDVAVIPAWLGWRLAFGLGAVLGLFILIVRRTVPESPRWLFTHGRSDEADQVVSGIEERTRTRLTEVAATLVRGYPRRTLLGRALFVGQAFLCNAVCFTQGLVLSRFFGVSSGSVGLYLVPLAAGSFVGPLVLARFFDSIGRRPMMITSYLGSGALLVGTGLLFRAGALSAGALTVAWCAVFFLASAGASSACLTVSEIFPLEVRALAIFCSVGTGLGGIIGPVLFGSLVETGAVGNVAFGYCLGAGMMIAGGLAEAVLGIRAERRSLESVAERLSAKAAAA
ncbi:MFS transporter [Amycolatopsis orientalis]|uniref:MFS transporter n=1 Tax=Amycolatopsis orientalis TaxID=31958 RepID=UPI001F1FB7D4|nr:MFS transporter [Amycolatopsis orientalis]